MKKKFLAALLALCLVFSLLPMGALADGDPAEEAAEDNATVEVTQQSAGTSLNMKPGTTYKLIEDINKDNATTTHFGIFGTVTSEEETILDLNGHSITAKTGDAYPAIYLAAGNLTIMDSKGGGQIIGTESGGKVYGAIGLIAGEAAKTLTIEKGVTVVGAEDQWCILVEGASGKKTNNATLNLNGCTLTSEEGSGVTVNGFVEAGTTLNLKNVDINVKGHGVYLAGVATTTITGGTIKGITGVEVRAGDAKVTGSKIIGGNLTASSTTNNNGTTTDNAGIAVAQHSTKKEIKVEIEESNVTNVSGAAAVYMSAPQEDGSAGASTGNVSVDIKGGTFTGKVENTDTNTSAKITITGGKFDTDVSKYMKDGSYITKSDDTYTVSKNVPTNAKVNFTDIRIVKDKADYDKLPECVQDSNAWQDNGSTKDALPWLVVLYERNAAPVDLTVYKDKTALEVATVDGNADKDGSPLASPATINAQAYAIWNLKYLNTKDNTTADLTGTYQVKATIGKDTAKRDAGSSGTVKYELAKPTLTVEATDETSVWSKDVSALQTSVNVTESGTTFKVTGVSKYISGWTSAYQGDEAKGNFVALKLTASESPDYTLGKIKVKLSSGTEKELDSGDTLVWRISNKANGKSIPVTVNYTVGEETKTVSYTIDLSGMTVVDEKVNISTDAGETVADVPDKALDNVPSDYKSTVKGQIETIAGSVESKVEDLLENKATASALNEKAAAAAKETGVTKVEVEIYNKVEATKVEADSTGKITSMTLIITPMYDLKVTKGEGSTPTTTTAKVPDVDKVKTEVTVELTGFATKDDKNVYAKHNGEWYVVTCAPKNAESGHSEEEETVEEVVGTFTTNGFSPFEFVKDSREVNVTTELNGGELSGTPITKLTAANIGTLPVPTKTGYKFTGWTWDGQTKATTTLSEAMFKVMYAEGPSKTFTLTANYSTMSNNNNNNNGGGGSSSTTTTPTEPTPTDPEPTEPVFSDVPEGAYYADAVAWAVEKGITNGTGNDTFSPNASCTRAQMVTFLWRLAGSPKAEGTNPFADVAEGSYYYDAVMWAVANGITNGTGADSFSPNATVDRAQSVTFLYRYAGTPAASGAAFADVAADAYYADAVAWAAANGVTNGTGDNTFSPANDCTRAQIVTFMFRYAG